MVTVRLFVGAVVLVLGAVVLAPRADADCLRAHVWLDRESAPPQDLVDQCPSTPYPTVVTIYKDTQQTGTLPPGSYNGAGAEFTVPLPDPS